MKKFVALLGALVMLLVAGAPAFADDGALQQTGRVLISIDGDVTLPPGEQAGAVIVVQGNALIEGTAGTVTVVGGNAVLRGARVETLAIIDGSASLEAGTAVLGDVLRLNAGVAQAEGVTIGGSIRPLEQDLAGFALFMGFAAVAIWLGALIAMLVAGLALAGLAARQVRTAEAIISREPAKAFLAGLAMVFLPPVVLITLAVTVVGLPLALSILLFVWPALAFVGYVVAAIWIGEWLLRTAGRREPTERPYLAAILGLLVAGVVSLVPLVGAVISIFGLGAVTIAGWRTLARPQPPRHAVQPHPAPVAG